MAKLEEITVGSTVNGIVGNEPVTIVAAQWYGNIVLVSTYVDEIVRYLMQVDGATVELKLEVDVTAPSGIPTTTVRTVSENCKTLKITDFGFDR